MRMNLSSLRTAEAVLRSLNEWEKGSHTMISIHLTPQSCENLCLVGSLYGGREYLLTLSPEQVRNMLDSLRQTLISMRQYLPCLLSEMVSFCSRPDESACNGIGASCL